MEEGTDKNNREEIFSKAVRAGKRTYFFDVKTTRGNDLYLTITESKRRYNNDGKYYYEKHKLFLYKEDFEKFSNGLTESVSKIFELRDSGDFEPLEDEGNPISSDSEDSIEPQSSTNSQERDTTSSFTSIEFEDLEGSEKAE